MIAALKYWVLNVSGHGWHMIVVIAMRYFVSLFFLLATPLSGAELTGKWIFSTNILGNRETVECTLRQDEKRISGSCKGEQFPEASAEGSINEENIRFSFPYVFAGQTYSCTYTGKLAGENEMNGSIVVTGIDGITGEFRGKKQPA